MMKIHRTLVIGIVLLALLSGAGWRAAPIFAQPGRVIEAVVLRNANLRMGPGITYAIIGAAKAGQLVTVTDDEGEWYQLSTGEWIAKFLVAATLDSQVVAFRLADAPATANRLANLRSGPGTTYAIVGRVQAGQSLAIGGQNQAGDWFRLREGQWIAAFLVDRVVVGLPIVDATTETITGK